MVKNQCHHFIYVAIIITFTSLIACNGSSAVTINNTAKPNDTEKQNKDQPPKTALANPAATRCVNDGYTLEPITVNGVSVDYLCVNQKNGHTCEVWEYFRNQCTLAP